MNVASSLGSQLPLLRRYTRALTGSQASGDAYVTALLEALIAEPSLFDSEADPRVEVYRLISALWSSLEVNMKKSAPEGWEATASRKLSAIAPRARQAFLLTSVEGFTLDETATILKTDAGEVAGLIDEASREIADQLHTRILIIEDEPLIAMDIERLVSELGHVPTGVARTHAEAVRLATADPPGLVLADIQLADGSSGIDAVHEILEAFNVPVIFITAFPERLLTGEKPEPAFLVTKPFMPEMVKAIISQALFFERKAGARSAAE